MFTMEFREPSKQQKTTASSDNFFSCECFEQFPAKVNEREEYLAGKFYNLIKDDLNGRGICPARGMVVAIKILAIMSRNIDADDRAKAEAQVHDVLDLEFGHNPSEH